MKFKSNAGSEGESKYFNVHLSPEAGYFVIDNLAVGLDLSVGFTVYDIGSDDSNTTTTIGAGPFVRYYIPTSNALPFLELGGAFGSQGTYTTINYGGGIGLAVPLGERVMVDVLAGYHGNYSKDREDNAQNWRTTTGNLGLSLGSVSFLGSNQVKK